MRAPVLPLALLALACADLPADQAPKEQLSHGELIYGNDDRIEYYQANATARAAADATVVLLDDSYLTRRGSSYDIYTGATLRNSVGVCSSEPFANQPAPGFCSGVLVGPDLVATAGHCVSSSRDCNSTSFVFGFRLDGAGNVRDTVSADDVYTCSSIVRSTTSSGDYAILRLDRPVTGRTPVPIRRSGTPATRTPLVLIGYPAGIPVKIAGGAEVKGTTSTYFSTNTDSYGGNSGSPIFNANTWEVEGLLVQGNNDWVRSGSCLVSNQCSDNGCPGFETATRASAFVSWVPDVATPVVPTCTDDRFENNDAITQATPLVEGLYTNLDLCGATESDWYEIDLTFGQTLTASIDFTHANGDLDMELYANGAYVAVSEGTTNNETLTYTASGPATVAVHVYGYNGAENAYDLDLQVAGGTSPTGCTDDAFEDNDAFAAAAPIGEGSYTGLQACASDDDWYSVPLAAGETITVTTTFVASAGNLDLQLYDAGVLVDASATTSGTERVTYTAPAATTVQIRVYGPLGAANAYGMDVALGGTVAPPSGGDYALSTSSSTASVGDWFTFYVADGPADTRVRVITGNASRTAGVTGCPNLTLDVGGNVQNIGRPWTDALGAGSLTLQVPAGTNPGTYTFQSYDATTCTKSNTVQVTIR